MSYDFIRHQGRTEVGEIMEYCNFLGETEDCILTNTNESKSTKIRFNARGMGWE